MSRWIDRAKSLPLYLLPHYPISAVVHAATRVTFAPWKNFLIRAFMRRFAVDLAESRHTRVQDFAHFNAFFTRELAPALRPLAGDERTVVSPVDGEISAIGSMDAQTIVQAKGRDFTAAELLGDAADAERFSGGAYATIYLCPRDYHRVHLPIAARLTKMRLIPGRLYSVAHHTVHAIPRLFARNERVVTLWDSPAGPLAVVLVGACCVASMETVWAGEVTPPRRRQPQQWDYSAQAIQLDRGAELGRFNMGSTVILLFGQGALRWRPELAAGTLVRMGQSMGQLAQHAAAVQEYAS